jgi:uncharacterized membrane protein YkvI
MNIPLRPVILVLAIVSIAFTIVGIVVRKIVFKDLPPAELNKKMSFRIFISLLMVLWCAVFITALIYFRPVLGY